MSHLFIALEHHAFKSVGAAIASDVAEDLQIAAVMGHIKDSVDWMLHQLDLAQVSRPVLRFFLKTKTVMKMKMMMRNIATASREKLTVSAFRLRFLRHIRTPSTDISMVTFFFFAFWILYSYCGKAKE